MDKEGDLKRTVLFLCTGNSCRSQMAEGWLKHLGGEMFEALSAGIEAHGLNPLAVQVMHEAGVDISEQESEIVTTEMMARSDLFVAVCQHAEDHCPVAINACCKDSWLFNDPAKAIGSEDEILNAFRKVRDEIRARVETFLQRPISL